MGNKRRPKIPKSPGDRPKVDYSASATSLAHQLDKANQTITDLEARVKAYQTRLGILPGTEHDPHRHDPAKDIQLLLERLAGALQLAGVVELAHTSAALHDGPPSTGLRDVERPLPGSSTHPARQRARDLRSEVSDALDRFDWAAENEWRRQPNPDASIPRVRCGNRECPAYDVTEKVWRRIRGGKTIYRQVCGSCGTPYSLPDENGSAA